MKARTKKKRGQAKKIEALERGNRYLADVVGRLMQEKANVQTAFKQIEEIYHGYLMAFVESNLGEVGISAELVNNLMKQYDLYTYRQGNTIWFSLMEKDDYLYEYKGDGKVLGEAVEKYKKRMKEQA
jgi:hypothetical protein